MSTTTLRKDIHPKKTKSNVISPENSRHFRNQTDSELQTIATWSLGSFRALGNLL